MKDLIERLERCEGPNFELDCAIFEKMLPTEMFGSKVSSWFRSDDTHYYGCNTEDGYRHLDCLRAPNYTASLDSALALVPRGWDCCLTQSFDEPSTACLAPAGKVAEVSADAPTLAIALCIAALKARVHLRDASEQKAVSPEGADGPSPERDMEGVR